MNGHDDGHDDDNDDAVGLTISGSKWIEGTIRQAHLAAQGQLKIGAQAAQSTLLRYERRCTDLT